MSEQNIQTAAHPRPHFDGKDDVLIVAMSEGQVLASCEVERSEGNPSQMFIDRLVITDTSLATRAADALIAQIRSYAKRYHIQSICVFVMWIDPEYIPLLEQWEFKKVSNDEYRLTVVS